MVRRLGGNQKSYGMTFTTGESSMKYNELNDKAKENARDRFAGINVDHEWWESAYEYAAAVASMLGMYDFEVQGFDLDRGYYVQYKGRFHAKDMKLDDLTDAQREQLKHITDPLAAQSALCAIHSQGSYLWADVTPSHRTSLNVDWQVWDTYDDEEIEDLLDGEAIEEAFKDFAGWIQGQLQAEYDHLTSDEAIEETIIANEYEFDEEGNLL
jgi:hypothetical protein